MKIERTLFGLLLAVQSAWGQDCAVDGRCDTHERCSIWKEEGECIRNKQYMTKHCTASCDFDQPKQTKSDCTDAHPRCPVWAKLGECGDNGDMKRYCAKSCETCHLASNNDDLCSDMHGKCSLWADSGECANNSKWMGENCPKSCNFCGKESTASSSLRVLSNDELVERTEKFGEPQTASGNDEPQVLEKMHETIRYMESEQVMQLPPVIRENCHNKNVLCSFWAVIGECDANESYMKINCAPACKSCHLIDMATRCPPLLEDAVPALQPGELNKMFERILASAPGNRTLPEMERRRLVEDGMSEYSVQVHSRPIEAHASEVSLVNDKSLHPWVVTFENFLTSEECDAMVQLGYLSGYKRSEDVGKSNFDGTVDSKKSEGRTSENAWCTNREGCRQEPAAALVHNRIANILGIPAENSEDFQLLRYEVGQFYRTHHDFIPHQKDRQCGPRILTFFIYLSDVDAGGGTDFPDLGITVMPKKGRALLWPSVYDSNPMMSDSRMMHQALPVEEGTKFAANGWIHTYDYIGPQARGCN